MSQGFYSYSKENEMEVFVALVFLAIPVWVIVKLKLVTNDLAHIKNNMEKDRINAVNAREEHYYDIASLIGGIRIENVSNVSNIVNQYKNQEAGNRSQLLNYFVDNRLKNLMEVIDEF